MAKLTDKEKKQIVADYVNCENYSEVARKYKRSVNTIKRVVLANEEIANKVKQKRKENTKDTLTFMEEQKDKIQNTLEALLLAMNYKAINLDEKATIRDLAMAYGIILDKQFRLVELARGTASNEQLSKVEELLTKLDEEARK